MTFAARLRLLLVLSLILVGVLVLDSLGLYGRPVCPWLQLTGTHCPACGGERALGHLADGQILSALHDNALVVLALPAVVLWLWWGYRRKPAPDRRLWYVLAGLALLYAVARNLPVFSGLAPM